jgi:spermidine synthase
MNARRLHWPPIVNPPQDTAPPTALQESPRLHTNSQTLSLSFETTLIQSCMRLDAPDDLVLDYTRAMMACLFFQPHPAAVLMIGLGGGSMLKYLRLHLPEADITAVEINQAVIDMRQAFHLPPDDARLRIVCADGAVFVRHPPRRYDLILVDGFTGAGLPPVLCSKAFYKRCRQALTDDGMLVANVQADTIQAWAILATLRKVFAGGLISVESEEGGNDIAFASRPAVLTTAREAFDKRWASLPATHRATLAAVSTRIERALRGHSPPATAPFR